jgi:hypothetical protein
MRDRRHRFQVEQQPGHTSSLHAYTPWAVWQVGHAAMMMGKYCKKRPRLQILTPPGAGLHPAAVGDSGQAGRQAGVRQLSWSVCAFGLLGQATDGLCKRARALTLLCRPLRQAGPCYRHNWAPGRAQKGHQGPKASCSRGGRQLYWHRVSCDCVSRARSASPFVVQAMFQGCLKQQLQRQQQSSYHHCRCCCCCCGCGCCGCFLRCPGVQRQQQQVAPTAPGEEQWRVVAG